MSTIEDIELEVRRAFLPRSRPAGRPKPPPPRLSRPETGLGVLP